MRICNVLGHGETENPTRKSREEKGRWGWAGEIRHCFDPEAIISIENELLGQLN